MIYRQYTAGTASNTVTSTMDIRTDDTIVGVVLDHSAIGAVDNDTFYAELSWQQTPSATTNDITNVIASVYFDVQVTTSGGTVASRQIYVPCNVKVFQGERLYLHTVNTGTGTSKAYATIITSKEAPKGGNRGR